MPKLKGEPFNPDSDIPDLSEKVIVITGGNTGIGAKACFSLAKHNASHIFVVARNPKTTEATINEIKGVVPNATRNHNQTQRLDILMCNAGILEPSGPPGLTVDGYEVQFGTNHLGHALLIKLLLPTLLKTAATHGDVRVISTASDGYRFHPSGGIAFKDLRTSQKNLGILGTCFSGWNQYFQSKLANIVYVTELARRFPSIRFIAIHPGIVDTALTPQWMKNPIMKRLTADTRRRVMEYALGSDLEKC